MKKQVKVGVVGKNSDGKVQGNEQVMRDDEMKSVLLEIAPVFAELTPLAVRIIALDDNACREAQKFCDRNYQSGADRMTPEQMRSDFLHILNKLDEFVNSCVESNKKG